MQTRPQGLKKKSSQAITKDRNVLTQVKGSNSRKKGLSLKISTRLQRAQSICLLTSKVRPVCFFLSSFPKPQYQRVLKCAIASWKDNEKTLLSPPTVGFQPEVDISQDGENDQYQIQNPVYYIGWDIQIMNRVCIYKLKRLLLHIQQSITVLIDFTQWLRKFFLIKREKLKCFVPVFVSIPGLQLDRALWFLL